MDEKDLRRIILEHQTDLFLKDYFVHLVQHYDYNSLQSMYSHLGNNKERMKYTLEVALSTKPQEQYSLEKKVKTG